MFTRPELVREDFTVRLAPAPYRVMGAAGKLVGNQASMPLEIAPAAEWFHAHIDEKVLRKQAYKGIFQQHGQLMTGFMPWNILAYPDLIRDLISPGRPNSSFRTPVLFRFQLYDFWERGDPLVRVPAGVTIKVTKKVAVGLTETKSHELSTSIGVEIALPGGAGKVTGGRTVKDTLTMTSTQLREDTREFTLAGAATGVRRYALWQRRTQVQIDALGSKGGQFYWHPIANETLNVDASIVPTSDDER